jgi:hypothetical protein
MGVRSCAVRENALNCEPLTMLTLGGMQTADLWESTESEADGIDVFEVEDEFEDE